MRVDKNERTELVMKKVQMVQLEGIVLLVHFYCICRSRSCSTTSRKVDATASLVVNELLSDMSCAKSDAKGVRIMLQTRVFWSMHDTGCGVYMKHYHNFSSVALMFTSCI